jgi:hypothetical protein
MERAWVMRWGVVCCQVMKEVRDVLSRIRWDLAEIVGHPFEEVTRGTTQARTLTATGAATGPPEGC